MQRSIEKRPFTKKDVDAYYCRGCKDGAPKNAVGVHVYEDVDLRVKCRAKPVYGDDEIARARAATASRGQTHAA